MINYLLVFLNILFFGLTLHAQNAKKLVKLGNELYTLQNYEQAIHAFSLALHFDTSLNNLYELRGDCYFYQKEWAQTISDYNLVRAPQDSIGILYREGHAYFRLDSFAQARKYFAEKLDYAPTDSLTLYELGLSHYYQEEYSDAYSYIQKSYLYGYETSQTFFLIAHSCYKQNDYRCAIEYHTRYQQNIIDSTSLVERGLSYRAIGKHKESNQDLLQLTSFNSDLLYAIAHNYYIQEDYENAHEYYSRVTPNEKFPNYYFELGLVLYSLNDYSKSSEAFTKYTLTSSNDENISLAEYYIAKILEIGENYEEAIAHFDKYLASNPNDSSAYWHRGYAHYQEYEWELAIKDFEKIDKWNQLPNNYHNVLGESYFENENYSDALKNFTLALEINPSDSSSYSFRSIAYAKQNDFSLSLNDMETFANGNDSSRIKNFFYLNREIRDSLKTKYWENALQKDSTDAVYTFFLGLDQKDTDEKVKLYHKAIKLDSNLYEPNFLLAQHYYFQQQFDSSYLYFKTAIQLKPHNLSLYKDAAKTLRKTENYSEGVLNAESFLSQTRSTSDSLAAFKLLAFNHLQLDSLTPTLSAELNILLIKTRLFPNDDIKTQYLQQIEERANFYFDEKKYQEALFWYNFLNKEQSQNEFILTRLATCYQKLGDFDKACTSISLIKETQETIKFKKKYCK